MSKSGKRWLAVLSTITGLFIVFIIIGIVASATHKKHHSTGTRTIVASTNKPAKAKKPKARESRDQKNARAYIKHYGEWASELQAAVVTAEGLTYEAAKSPNASNISQLAQAAVGAHTELNDLRGNFAGDFGDGALGSAQLEVFGAANDLKNSMGTLATLSGDPENAEVAAEFKQQFQDASSEWNQGVRKIWGLAKMRGAPTV